MNDVVTRIGDSYRRTVFTKNGLSIEAILLRGYEKGKVLYAQERIIITDHKYNEIKSLDLIDFISEVM